MEIIDITENKDNTVHMEYELTDEECKLIKKHLKGKRLTKKRVNKVILEALRLYCHEEVDRLFEEVNDN